MDYAKLIMGTLGHKVFIPLSKAKSAVLPKETEETGTGEDTIFCLSRAIKQYNIAVHTKARQTSEGFVILTGSIVSPKDGKTLHDLEYNE